ncbi:MAG: hypothetical protein H6719_06340 [Sandaracinaceae bacterium]|nr:hypothetical protein [Sandaracinaceae bacterium]
MYEHFLGTWALEPESCQYEQGDPPRSGLYRIEAHDGRLHFSITWEDAAGASHAVSFSGTPDGEPEPFDGGDLADALVIRAVSERELVSSALYRGVERMVAQRQLDDSRTAMRVVQVVRLPDGTSPANVAIYVKQPT